MRDVVGWFVVGVVCVFPVTWTSPAECEGEGALPAWSAVLPVCVYSMSPHYSWNEGCPGQSYVIHTAKGAVLHGTALVFSAYTTLVQCPPPPPLLLAS